MSMSSQANLDALLQLQQSTEVSEGIDRLDALRLELAAKPADWNEAQTRFHIIDRLLVECLGYPRTKIEVERHHDGE